MEDCFRQSGDVFIDDFSDARWASDVRARAKIFLQHEHVLFLGQKTRERVCERLLLCAFFMTPVTSQKTGKALEY